jgi:hypothetical protein
MKSMRRAIGSLTKLKRREAAYTQGSSRVEEIKHETQLSPMKQGRSRLIAQQTPRRHGMSKQRAAAGALQQRIEVPGEVMAASPDGSPRGPENRPVRASRKFEAEQADAYSSTPLSSSTIPPMELHSLHDLTPMTGTPSSTSWAPEGRAKPISYFSDSVARCGKCRPTPQPIDMAAVHRQRSLV